VNIHDLRESLILWLLALSGGLEVGRTPVFGFAFCFTLAIAYTMPLTNPTVIAETLGKVTGASKKMRPDRAMGSLFKAPTMEYVVEEVTRTHHADVYEMKTDERPERIMAIKMLLRSVRGKLRSIFAGDQSSTTRVKTISTGIERRLL
jgi:hypothetical protein